MSSIKKNKSHTFSPNGISGGRHSLPDSPLRRERGQIKKGRDKIIATNKNSLFNYEVIETYQAGLVLSGPEVKATKLGNISLKGSYVTIDQNGEAWLMNSYITPYKPATTAQKNYDPGQKRKLLLHKKEIDSLLGKSQQKGLTIIPINVYTNKRLIKTDIALARGKTKTDKRETIKKRETDREISRTLKQR